MRDTRPEDACRYHEQLAALPVERRALMVADLFAPARSLARAGIASDRPFSSEAEIQKEIFLRFYGHELPQPLLDKAVADIDRRYATTPATA